MLDWSGGGDRVERKSGSVGVECGVEGRRGSAWRCWEWIERNFSCSGEEGSSKEWMIKRGKGVEDILVAVVEWKEVVRSG